MVFSLIFYINARRLSLFRCSKNMHFLRCIIRFPFVYSGQLSDSIWFFYDFELSIFSKSRVLSPEIPFLTLNLFFSLLLLLSWNTSSGSSSLTTYLSAKLPLWSLLRLDYDNFWAIRYNNLWYLVGGFEEVRFVKDRIQALYDSVCSCWSISFLIIQLWFCILALELAF